MADTILSACADRLLQKKLISSVFLTGEGFEKESPAIAGWRPVRLKVSGVNSGRNENYTVLYVPEDTIGAVDMDDLRTPADLGDVYLQVGICAE